MTSERLAAYRLIRVSEIGSRTLERIRGRYERFAPFIEDRSSWKETLTEAQTEGLARSISDGIEKDLALMEREGISFLLPEEPGFPPRLNVIPAPPGALFVRGGDLTDRLAIAIVGTRKMTPYGERTAAFFASELAALGAVIVSGLALGIDAAAHRACLDAGGRTVAVVPGGTDDRAIVPQSHLPIARKIIASGGSVCSEKAPGTDARPYDYLHRNRIISGLADAVIVVEGDRDSGALVTAKHALDQGKDVLAIPGPIWSNASRGTNELIKNGATLCSSIDDVLSALRLGDISRAKEAAQTREMLPSSPEESEIIALLEAPMGLDELVRRSKKTVSEVSGTLSILEMKGRVIAVGPRTYARV
jgi:DNA processing protein